MGILNVTPDSFSDGGRFLAVNAATDHGLALLERGADILDIGAESTRPNATPIDSAEEQARLLPVLESIRKANPGAILSVDTYHACTARAAMEGGAEIINDVSGLTWDRSMAGTVADGAGSPGLVLMHTRGRPREWQTLRRLDGGAVEELVRGGLRASLETAKEAGISLDRIVLDPGFGFGKLREENFSLLARLSSLGDLGRPLLAGLSRKGFLAQAPVSAPVGEILTDSPVPATMRLHATLAANTAAILAGAHVVRVHDVGAATEAASVADALLAAL